MYEKYLELRDSMGISDYEVAKSTGIGSSTFSDWKSGRSKPGTEKLFKIAKFFGVTIEYFIEE